MKPHLVIGALALVAALLLVSYAMAQQPASPVQCTVPGQPCKIITLTPDEEKVLVDQRGILDSAASARMLDLANAVAYFRQKIQDAPHGEIRNFHNPDVEKQSNAPAADKPEAPKP